MPSSGIIEKLLNGVSFEMVFVEGGTFMMGSEDDEAWSSERPVHKVQLNSFYIGKFPVTQELWISVMDANPSFFIGNSRPVETVSWEDTQVFIERLNKVTENTYRLPSEIEWEFAARGGNLSRGYKYSGSNKLKEVGWYEENSHGETKAVGLKYPNELGLYDMSGNVWEWMEEQWHNYEDKVQSDKERLLFEEKRDSRILRGGSWNNSPLNCRCTFRFGNILQGRGRSFGLRLCLSL